MEILSPPDVRPKRPPGRKPKHSESFRWMVAQKVCKDGMSYREAGKTFGLSHGSISALVKRAVGRELKFTIAKRYLGGLMAAPFIRNCC
jgi:hypothetical protein